MMRHLSVAALLSIPAAYLLLGQAAPVRVESRGASVRVPADWNCNDRLLAAGGPIACTSFTGPYANGGLLPPGGAEIEITSVPRPLALDSYARGELKGAKDLKFQETSSAGRLALRASYTDEVAPGISAATVIYYVAQGNRLYKFYLTYWSGDTHEREFGATLETVVREAVLK
jgi:hypothetical protein